MAVIDVELQEQARQIAAAWPHLPPELREENIRLLDAASTGGGNK